MSVGEAVRLFRVTAGRYADDPFSGLGGLYAEGRWHPQGVRFAYAAETSSLALLELLVQAPRARLAERAAVAGGLVLVEAVVPAVDVVRVESWVGLPDGWDALPPPYGRAAQAVGARFVRKRPAPVLSVPSAVNPRERNLLVNPLHDGFGAVDVVGTSPVALDARLLR